jgi:hypothetical protein
VKNLDYQQRLRMAWEFTWPMTLIDLVFVFVVHGLIEPSGETWDSIWAVVSFVAVWPWIIGRAFRRDYGPYRVMAMRSGTGSNKNLSPPQYQENLKVMWLLAWRSLALLLIAGFLISLLLRLIGSASHDFSSTSPLVNNLGLDAVDAVSDLLFFPLLIPGMLRKHYRGFDLVLEPAEPRGISGKKL